jgi:hypothetical protein
MMQRLGIKRLRAGANPQKQDAFTEANANRFMDSLPDPLTGKVGKITRAGQWPKRRAEIQRDFETEIYGRIPEKVPPITWKTTETKQGDAAGISTITTTLVGHVDNSAYPQIVVDIQATFTVPANTPEPVPLLIMFSPRPGRG